MCVCCVEFIQSCATIGDILCLFFSAMAYVPVDNGPLTFVVLCFVLRVFLSVGCTAINTACFTLCAKEFPDHIATVFVSCENST